MKERFEYSSFTIRSLLEEKFCLQENSLFNYISTSSEECEKNTLFVPLKGNRDGHEFIPDALEKGATHFLCECNHPILETLNEENKSKAILVKNTLEALGKLANFHRKRFSPLVIAVTGSSGKTTTKDFLYYGVKYLEDKHLVVTEKNYNNEIGLPFTIFKINANTKIVVCEMGMNHLHEISRLTQMALPHAAIITNIGQAHIENLGSVENIAYAKSEIIEGICANGYLFVPENIQKREILEKKAMSHNVNVLNYSLNSSYLKILEEHPNGFILEVYGKKLNWNLPGRHLLWNLAGVLFILSFLGFDKEKVLEGISKFEPTNKRNVWIHYKNFHILDDTYNANPDSMIASLDTLKQASSNFKRYAILGDMKELGEFSEKFHKEVGIYASQVLDGLISFGSDARFYFEEFSKHKNNKFNLYFSNTEENIQKIVEYVTKNLKEESFLLVKGSRSMRMERVIEKLVE